MPIELVTPSLDNRTFEEIKQQALLRIPRYTPEWTDWNESDPGVTLVELFAWLTEMMLYQMNRLPERNYLKFLQSLGLELRPAQAAVAYLSFTPKAVAGSAAIPNVPQYTQVGGQAPSGGPQLIFETSEGLGLIRLPLTDVQVFDGAAFTVVSPANANPGTTFRPFGWQPVAGSALYLGFTQTTPQPLPEPLFPQEMRWRVFLPLSQIENPAVQCEAAEIRPAPPVTLVWEYRPAANPGFWRRLQVFDDQSLAFTREGAVLVEGPVKPALTPEGRILEPRIWLRVRLAEGTYPAGTAPLIDFIRPNVVAAENLSTIRNEPLGESLGTPDQSFQLRYFPVMAESLSLELAEPGSDPAVWQRVDDLLASGEDDAHYTLNAATGEIRFGDGVNGRVPVALATITAAQYRYGGGDRGNLSAGLINALLNLPLGVEGARNERPAVGGRDEESLAEFIRFAPARLRCRERAVSAEDYTSLAMETGGVANAVALPLFHPDHPGVQVPGALTVVVVPDTADRPPRPSRDQLEVVCAYLNKRRLLTAEVYVKEPDYLPVQVEAVVEANPYAAFDLVASQVKEAINLALDPLVPDAPSGAAADGVTPRRKVGRRKFGEDFFPTTLFNDIQDVKDVRAVRNLIVTVDGQRLTDNNKPFPLKPDQLLYSAADHMIKVVPVQDV